MTQSEEIQLRILKLLSTKPNFRIDIARMNHLIETSEEWNDLTDAEVQREVVNMESMTPPPATRVFSSYPNMQVNGYEMIKKTGESYLRHLDRKKSNEEIFQGENEQDKMLLRLVNQSTIDTNKSFLRLNVHQRINMWIMAVIAIFAVLVAYNQLKNDLEQKRQDKQGQESLKKIQSQINTLKMSLDSMRDSRTSDTTSKTK